MSHGHSEWLMKPDEITMRSVLGHFATGVAVITACDGDKPVGMACNSFTSVSLDPPLVLFCAAKSSSTWPRIQRAGTWVGNVLAQNGEEMCRTFAARDLDRFAGVGWSAGVTGSPVLDDALAYVECSTEAIHEAGDHMIVVGRVAQLGHAVEGKPLLFYRGGYGRFEA